jgi:hypothetical protein
MTAQAILTATDLISLPPLAKLGSMIMRHSMR